MPGDQWELSVAIAARHCGWLEDDLSEAGSPVDGLDVCRYGFFSWGVISPLIIWWWRQIRGAWAPDVVDDVAGPPA